MRSLMKQRIVSAIFFGIAMLGGIFGGAVAFYILFTFITAGCLYELGTLSFDHTEPYYRLRRIIAIILGAFPFVLFGSRIFHFPLEMLPDLNAQNGLAGLPQNIGLALLSFGWLFPALFMMFILELYLKSARPFQNVGTYLLGIVYIGIPMVLLSLLAFKNGQYASWRVFGPLLLTWINDSMAYFTGSFLGKTPFFPRISPKKTWEGTVGGVIFTFGVAYLLSNFITDYTAKEWMALALIVGVFGTLGDLVESMLKRSAQIKDSGSLIPGHGGLLDRFDAFIFAIPFINVLISFNVLIC